MKDIANAYPLSSTTVAETVTGEAFAGSHGYTDFLGSGRLSDKIPVFGWWAKQMRKVATEGRAGAMPIGEESFRLNLFGNSVEKLEGPHWFADGAQSMRPKVGPDLAGPWAGVVNDYLKGNVRLKTAEMRAGIEAALKGGTRPSLSTLAPDLQYLPAGVRTALEKEWQKAGSLDEWYQTLNNAKTSLHAQAADAAARAAHEPIEVGVVGDTVASQMAATIPPGAPAQASDLAEQVAQGQQAAVDDMLAQAVDAVQAAADD